MPYANHPILTEPPSTQQLWRYMDIAKFIALLQSKSLYFPSVHQLSLTDPWEGLPSSKNFDANRPIFVYKNNVQNLDGTTDYNNPANITYHTTRGAFHGSNLGNDNRNQQQFYREDRKKFYVSCWHMNDCESDSQWKIYGNSTLSVAIVSSFQKIRAAISDPKTIYGGTISYYHPDKHITPEGNAFYQVIFKRQAFLHEREFRLIFWNHSNDVMHTDGMAIAVDVEELIEYVTISPHAPTWFVDVVASLIKDYGFKIPYRQSNLLEVCYIS